MASRSKGKRTSSRKSAGGETSHKPSKAKKERAFRRLDEAFREWRFEPKAGGGQYAGVVLLSLGAVALGAALYGTFLSKNPEGPAAYSPYIFAGGALLLAVGLLVGQSAGQALRVGLFGVGFEQDGKTSRMRWYEMDTIEMVHGALRISGAGKPMTLSLQAHGPALRRIVAEANKRIPDRVELDDDGLNAIGRPQSSEGERIRAEPPQVTSERCRASDKALTFEEDVRLCGRCAVPYHKAHTPRTCQACGYKLKR